MLGAVDLLTTDPALTEDLPGFPWRPRRVDLPRGGGDDATLQMAYLDEGPTDGPVVLALHGEPSWGYLYRGLVAPLVAAGLRVIIPDLVGFGRSDKPAARTDHTYEAHVTWLRAFVEATALQDITLLCQDWGGLLGLPLVAGDPGRFAAVVAANTGLPDGGRRMPEPWWRFHDFVARTPELPVGFLVDAGVRRALTDAERAAYDAPFPTAAHQAGPHAMPGLIPQEPDAPYAAETRAAWEVLAGWHRPFLTAFSDGDPITAGGDRWLQERIPGAHGRPHTTLPGGHFLQEDCPDALAAVVVEATRLARA